ncbi:MAG: InlB B-repeat-containing protein [Treponema sp.]|nr:InlB B-repeat-containing protein [Treponema sp.]
MIFRKLFAVLLAAVFTDAVLAKDVLAVLPFTGGVGEEGETIAELFSYTSEIHAEFMLIPRTSISNAIGSEQKFQTATGMTDPDSIAAIGAQLGAKYVVAGKIASLENSNLLIISIIKIDDLRQIAGDIQTYARIEEIQSKLPLMAQNIINAMRLDASRPKGLDKLAVTPVAMGGGNIDAGVADTLSQILSINIIRSGKYAVYPRTATLEQVQTEYDTQLSGVTADKEMVDIGKGENPRFVLSVAARRLGSRNMFNASIINLESGVQLIGGSEGYNSLSDGRTAMTKLAQILTQVSIADEEWTITFNLDGGTINGAPMAITRTVLANGVLGANAPSEPTRSGYVFGGWWTERNGAGARFTASTTANANMTVYAKWIRERTVTFNLDGGRVNGKTAAITQKIPDDTPLGASTPPEPTRNKYVFDGWYTRRNGGGTRFTSSTLVNADIIVYAKWVAEFAAAATVAAKKTEEDAGNAPSSTPVSSPPRRGRDSGGAVFRYGALNLAAGLGSLIQGDRAGWLITLLSYGAAAGLIYWETTLDYYTEYAGIPGGVGLGAAGFAVLYGFIRPVVFNNNRSLAELIDHIEIGVAPGQDGRELVRLAWTVTF